MVYFTVGPTQLFSEVKNFIKEALTEDILSISHRGEKFKKIYDFAERSLRKLLDVPDTHEIFFFSSATEIMERILQNCVEKHSFHVVNGAFSERFYQIARELGKEPHILRKEWGSGIYPDEVKVEKQDEIICMVQNETSTGVSIPMEVIYGIKESYPDKILAIDIVSSAPYVDINFRMVDIAFFSVQKGFGLPAGLGVCILHKQCIQKAKSLANRGISIGSYHGFLNIHKKSIDKQTVETPNVLGIYLLGKICEFFISKGTDSLKNIVRKHAGMIYESIEDSKVFGAFVKENYFRSETTIVLECKYGSKSVLDFLRGKGIEVSSGYGKFKDRHLRIGNFAMHTTKEVEELLTSLNIFEEKSLKS